jgi:protein gp37
MGRNSGIEWTDHTFNPWWGCVRVSPACDHCYAEALDHRFGFAHWGQSAPRRKIGESYWDQPIRWNAAAEASGVNQRVFCGSMCDVMEPRPDLHPIRERLYHLILDTPSLTWMLLTKRPQEFKRLLPPEWVTDGCPENVWLLTTVESPDFLWRVSRLREVPAKLHGLSMEPLLAEFSAPQLRRALPGIGWIITGHESGHGARTTEDAWTRTLRDVTADLDIPFFYKQANICGVVESLPELDGRRYSQIPTV